MQLELLDTEEQEGWTVVEVIEDAARNVLFVHTVPKDWKTPEESLIPPWNE